MSQIPGAPLSITEPTAKLWMIFLGFFPTNASKGWFTDGHEREDVIRFREEIFLPKMALLETQIRKYTKESNYTEFILPDGPSESVIITHDESTTYANEGRAVFYMEGGKKKCLPKGRGLSLMISGFVCQCHGFMEFEGLKSYQLFEFGKNRDGAWCNADLIEQARICKPIFEGLHPNCTIFVGFDNSMNHHKKAPDGLDATMLLLKDGGKNTPIMRDGWYLKKNEAGVEERVVQKMQHKGSGIQKGLETILTERNKFDNGNGHRLLKICQSCLKKVHHDKRDWTPNAHLCCATYVLSQEPDFLEQQEWLTEVIEDELKFNIFFYPKYHCELNFIEQLWGWIKAYLRRHCKYSFNELKGSIDDVVMNKLPIQFVRKASDRCFRYMSGYRKGLTGAALEYTVKRFRGHRCLPAEESFAKLVEDYEALPISKKIKVFG